MVPVDASTVLSMNVTRPFSTRPGGAGVVAPCPGATCWPRFGVGVTGAGACAPGAIGA